MVKKLLAIWFAPYGAPEMLVVDQCEEFEGAFIGMSEEYGSIPEWSEHMRLGSTILPNDTAAFWGPSSAKWWPRSASRAETP